ncbi:hypothetical protein BDK51DRAFT_51439 [Blyttiomyces helicus]|uniref:Peptidase S74 domain-containing protein n=1 Tax=Blyttiomyces helicus TaxID=388810 RepID=A0A4P9WQH8_9FUNG|nr:hypothetical protein BDK51DRAFT_51439 [Blyttiomyces helicus]|eukprot:RKO94852.1 hypothetical protein BDK51DRAFT_51439 [Blyttiomyces helicus]
MTLDGNGTLTINGTTENTGYGTGSLIISGGGSIGSGLSINGTLSLCGTTTGVVNFVAPSSSTSPTFTLPSALPSQSGQVLVSDTNGNLSFTNVNSSLNYTSVSAMNNVASPTNVTGLVMNGPQFSITILVTTANSDSSLSTVTLSQIEGVQQFSNSWTLSQTTTGPSSGVIFSILNSGQIQYTSAYINGWVSTTFQFYSNTEPLQTAVGFASLLITSTTDSTSTTTGCITLAGGIGITDRATLGNALNIFSGGTNGIQIKNGLNSVNNRQLWFTDRSAIIGAQSTDGSTFLPLYTSSNFLPSADNAYTLGTPNNRWSAIYSANGTLQTSDENMKRDIEDLRHDFAGVVTSDDGVLMMNYSQFIAPICKAERIRCRTKET